MARISTYSLDTTVNPDDVLIGTDSADSDKTKNFKASTFASFAETNAEVTETLTRTLTVDTNTLLETPPASLAVNLLTKGSLVYFDATFAAGLDAAAVVDTDYVFKGSFTLPMADYEPNSAYVPGTVQVLGPVTSISLNDVASLITNCIIISGQGEADTTVNFAVYANYSTLVSASERFSISGNYQI